MPGLKRKNNNPGINMWYADRQNPTHMWRGDPSLLGLHSAWHLSLVIACQEAHVHMTLIGG